MAKYVRCLLVLSHIVLHAGDGVKIPKGTAPIKEATHYYYNASNIGRVMAYFYRYNANTAAEEFIKAVTVEQDSAMEDVLNKRLDPNYTLPVITFAKIIKNERKERSVLFKDASGKVIIQIPRYGGSIDLKSEKDNTQLIKPHCLLDSLEKVTEKQKSHILLRGSRGPLRMGAKTMTYK